MNGLDIVLAVPLLWGLVQGFSRGLITELARIVALIAGVYLAVRFSELLSEYLYQNTELTNEFLPIISFAIILVGVIISVHLFAKAISKLVDAAALGWANKAAGAFFGFFRTAFLLSLAIMLISRFDLLQKFNRGDLAQDSFLYAPTGQLAPAILPILNNVNKDSILDRVDRKVGEVEDVIREIIE